MKVERLMTREVVSCSPQDSLEHAAHLMWQHDCGCLPVTSIHDATVPCGMITDRDICMAALFKGKTLGALRVEDAMEKNLQTCQPGDTLVEVECKMQNARIRRLPVVNDAGALIGIISMADLAVEAARLQYGHHREISGSEVMTTLASICKPAKSRHAAA